MNKRIAAQSTPSANSRLSPVIANVTTLAKTLGRATTRLAQSMPTAQEALKLAQEVQNLIGKLTAATTDIDELLADLTKHANTAFNALDADLRDALSAHGWRCDGQWPTLYVQRAICIQIDQHFRSAAVGATRVPIASVERIVEALEPLVETLVPKDFVAEDFISNLALAYDNAKRGSSLAPILDVYREFVVQEQKPKFWRDAVAARFVGVSTDQFRGRLSAALEQGVITSRDRRHLRLLAPLDPKEGLFIYQPAEKRFGFVGRVEFVPAA